MRPRVFLKSHLANKFHTLALFHFLSLALSISPWPNLIHFDNSPVNWLAFPSKNMNIGIIRCYFCDAAADAAIVILLIFFKCSSVIYMEERKR